MVEKKKYKKHLLTTTILLLIFVFVGGILLGKSLSTSDLSQVTELLRENELNSESYLVEQELIKNFAEDNCKLAAVRISSISDDLGEVGFKLVSDDAEKKLGSSNYNFLKRKFHLMQIKTYILFKKYRDKCFVDTPVILYYYSRDDPDSAKQGPILDRIVRDFDVNVFAVEYGYSKELQFLESFYDIDSTPAVVVNYDFVFRGLTDYDTIVDKVR